MEPKLKILIREPKSSDLSFIYSTWLESYRYDSSIGKSHKNSIFFSAYAQTIDHIFSKPSTKCFIASEPDFTDTILGYIVAEPHTPIPILHYIYTKGSFRKLGIAQSLMLHVFNLDPSSQIFHTHQTFLSAPILDQYPSMVHNAMLLYSKLSNEKEIK